jgi:hypothetical protein
VDARELLRGTFYANFWSTLLLVTSLSSILRRELGADGISTLDSHRRALTKAYELRNRGSEREWFIITINFGFSVSDTLELSTASTLNGLSFWAWVEPGDAATSVEVQLSQVGYFGNELFDGTVSLTRSNCFTNNFGFDVCAESGTFSGPALNPGDYYLTLTNAATVEGNPLYWDENSGVGCLSRGCPSSAQENTLGTIPSEAFTLYGTRHLDLLHRHGNS